MTPLRIFIGYDSREPVAFAVLVQSILSRASVPVSITPLALPTLRHVFTRERGPTESTEFAISRFLVPALCDFQGLAIFMDCDMLCQVDIADIMLPILAHPGKAVYCCQHDYEPATATKFLDQTQTRYPRKNWTSFMVFDCARCAALQPEYVNRASGLDLHRFHWLRDDEIGRLPLEWNWLVGEYPANPEAHILHYTLGGPWFNGFQHGDHAERWLAAASQMMAPVLVEVSA